MSSFYPKVALALGASAVARYASNDWRAAVATGVATGLALTALEAINYCNQLQQPQRRIDDRSRVVPIPRAVVGGGRSASPSRARPSDETDPRSDFDLAKIAQENKEILNAGGYWSFGDFVEVEKPKSGSLLIDPTKGDFAKIDPSIQIQSPRDTQIEVVNGDCLDEALRLQDRFKNVCLLNMAHAYKAGGGYLQGASAEEEILCRRIIGLYPALTLDFLKDVMARRYSSQMQTFHKTRCNYHIPEKGCIVSRDLQVIRDANNELLRASDGSPAAHEKVKNPKKIDVISAAAYNLNDRMHMNDSKKFRTQKDYEDATKDKIRTILKTAILTGHDAIVLSAFGCGAFKNKPEVVARLFDDVLKEPVDITGAPRGLDTSNLRGKYRDAIKVVFAIKGGGSNFDIFKDRLQTVMYTRD